jgi:hypothetical protein
MSALDNVEYLLRKVPQTAQDQNLMTLLYWKLFDDIDIPKELMLKLRFATNPETIYRYKRMCLHTPDTDAEVLPSEV